MAGPTPLPWQMPCKGVVLAFPPYDAVESRYPVLTLCTASWRVVNIQLTMGLGTPILLIAIVA